MVGIKGYVTDFMGIRHRINVFPSHYEVLDGTVCGGLPIPDDGIHAETIEYIGTFMSIEDAGSSYSMFELGAGWGPWMSISGLAALKKGINNINLIGVEGESHKIDFIKKHLTENGLRPTNDNLKNTFNGVTTTIYNGVINSMGQSCEFPDASYDDYGSSLVDGTSGRDVYNLITVPGYSFENISREYTIIDFVHMDLQGYELEFIESCIDLFCRKVKYIFIGTHSREIESLLINFLYKRKFKLLREQPCCVHWPEQIFTGTWINQTIKDGGQLWKNLDM
jgi:hypothetical protein